MVNQKLYYDLSKYHRSSVKEAQADAAPAIKSSAKARSNKSSKTASKELLLRALKRLEDTEGK